MQASHNEMQEVFSCNYCSLHVRITNRAALGLYKDKLGYEIYDIEKGYYADHEDALNMVNYFNKSERPKYLPYEMT